MSTTRRFCCDDLLKFNNVNLDVLTETVRIIEVYGVQCHVNFHYIAKYFSMIALVHALPRVLHLPEISS